jgi:hypothetical protein
MFLHILSLCQMRKTLEKQNIKASYKSVFFWRILGIFGEKSLILGIDIFADL